MNALIRFSGIVWVLSVLACANGDQIKRLQADQNKLLIKQDSLIHQNMQLELMRLECIRTKQQLDKTENTLIQFYLKYENSSGGESPKMLKDYLDSIQEVNKRLSDSNYRMIQSQSQQKILSNDSKNDLPNLTEWAKQKEGLQKEMNDKVVELEQVKTQNGMLLQKIEYLNRLLSESQSKISGSDPTKSKEIQLQSTVVELNQKVDELNLRLEDIKTKLASREDSLHYFYKWQMQNVQTIKKLEEKNGIVDQTLHASEAQRVQMALQQDTLHELRRELYIKNQQIENLDRSIQQMGFEKSSKNYGLDSIKQLVILNNTLNKSIDVWKHENDSLKAVVGINLGKQQFLKQQLERTEQEVKLLKSQQNKIDQSTKPRKDNVNDSPRLRAEILKNLSKYPMNQWRLSTEGQPIQLMISQQLLFHPQSFAMTEEGTAWLSRFQAILNKENAVNLVISGFSNKLTAESLSVDQMVRNAGTVFKLFSALGTSPVHMKIAARYLSTNEQEHLPLQGIEFQIEAH